MLLLPSAGDSVRGLLDPPAAGVSACAALAIAAGTVLAIVVAHGGGGLLAGDRALLAHQGAAASPTLVVRSNPIGETLVLPGQKLHLPAHAYLFGLNHVADHNAGGHASYLLGMRSDTGWWYYFPVVFAVKSTMAALAAALLLLLAAGLVAGVAAGMAFAHGAGPRAAAAAVFRLQHDQRDQYRHAAHPARLSLPLRGRRGVARRTRANWRPAACIVLAGAGGSCRLAECARITPDYLAFFNELAGGPGRGPEYLVDSNIDWGQDVKKLGLWLDAHGGKRRARVFYFGNAQMRYYGIDELGYPEPLDQKGWDEIDEYCVANVTPLQGVYVPLNCLAPLRLREPVAKIGWSMYVYDLRKSALKP